MATLKQLKIQTNICRRVLKELVSYEKEVESESAKTANMHKIGSDSHDIKQQENVLAESKMMVPECRKRLKEAVIKLQDNVAEAEEENLPDEQGDEIVEIKDARKLIKDVEDKLV
ncbi:unnamed protein product [Calypogeia fissa]